MELVWIVQALVGVLLGIGAFTFKTIYDRMDRTDGRLISLEVEMAKNMEQNKSIFARLSQIEEKIDKLLELR